MKKFLSFFSPAPQRIRIENRLEQESILRIGIGIRIVKIQTMPNPSHFTLAPLNPLTPVECGVQTIFQRLKHV